MKKYLKAIEELRLAYPNLEYIDGCLFNAEELIEEQGKELIEDFYDGYEIWEGDGSGNPEKEELRLVSGKEYIEVHYYGDYEEAYNQIP